MYQIYLITAKSQLLVHCIIRLYFWTLLFLFRRPINTTHTTQHTTTAKYTTIMASILSIHHCYGTIKFVGLRNDEVSDPRMTLYIWSAAAAHGSPTLPHAGRACPMIREPCLMLGKLSHTLKSLAFTKITPQKLMKCFRVLQLDLVEKVELSVPKN